jgi:predicted Zn-dependent protease with MMP-like domain
MNLSREEFEKLVEEEFASLPQGFRRHLENVHVVVEERPDESLVRRQRVRSGTLLLGLYEGVPLTKRGTGYGMYPVLPDRITIFKENLERISHTYDELVVRTRETLIHEVGHYYGMSEQQIREAGY